MQDCFLKDWGRKHTKCIGNVRGIRILCDCKVVDR